MFKKIILTIIILLLFTLSIFGQTGTVSLNGYFYKPLYGAFGILEYNTYNTYIDIADTQIEANKDAIAGMDLSLYYLKTQIDTEAEMEAIWGVNIATTANKLSAFAATTSAELAGVISDETGTDKLVYNTSPVLVTPTLGAASATSIDLTGGQIAFPASQSASAGANTLDDYEEGVWTPVITFGAASVGITYTAQTGFYTKVGRTVTVSCYILLSNKGSSTGSAQITGLPFTSMNVNGAAYPVNLRVKNITFANYPMGHIWTNTSLIELWECTDAGTESNLADTDFGNTSSLMISAVYFTS
jgi:hypothetical protein